jgi:hypothetical protein
MKGFRVQMDTAAGDTGVFGDETGGWSVRDRPLMNLVDPLFLFIIYSVLVNVYST